jgi:hypothetical protein
MCKHICAALYGVGARLDEEPELLFRLRQVDHMDLVATAGTDGKLGRLAEGAQAQVLETSDLSEVFGIDIELEPQEPELKPGAKAGRRAKAKTKKKKKKSAGGRRARRGKARRAGSKKSVSKSAARAGASITARQLIERGVPRSTFQNWVTAGVLLRTDRRGVYKTTGDTEARIRKALQRQRRR